MAPKKLNNRDSEEEEEEEIAQYDNRSQNSENNCIEKKDPRQLAKEEILGYSGAQDFKDFIEEAIIYCQLYKYRFTTKESCIAFVKERLLHAKNINIEKKTKEGKYILIEYEPIDIAEEKVRRYKGAYAYSKFISKKFNEIRKTNNKNPEKFITQKECIDFLKDEFLNKKKIWVQRSTSGLNSLQKLTSAQKKHILKRKRAAQDFKNKQRKRNNFPDSIKISLTQPINDRRNIENKISNNSMSNKLNAKKIRKPSL